MYIYNVQFASGFHLSHFINDCEYVKFDLYETIYQLLSYVSERGGEDGYRKFTDRISSAWSSTDSCRYMAVV